MAEKKGVVAEKWLKNIQKEEGATEIFIGIVKDGLLNVSINGEINSMIAMVAEMGRMVKVRNAN